MIYKKLFLGIAYRNLFEHYLEKVFCIIFLNYINKSVYVLIELRGLLTD